MATGYDNRTPARRSFAFNPTAPVQASSAPSGASRGAQVVGGGSQGQAILSGPQTAAGPIAGGLGRFFEGVMQPYLERKQQENFYKGFTEAASGVALQELSDSDSPITKIFGPTGFEQGAQFYAAQTALNRYGTEINNEIDTLRKLPPNEAAKLLAEKSRSLMTGDTFADQLIQAGLIERMGPVMQTVATARFAWGQEQAVQQASDAWSSAADLLQQNRSALPEGADASGMNTAFLRGMAKPEGMTDESYQTLLYTSMKGMMASGNGYAVNQLRQAGLMEYGGPLTDDQVTKLEDAYEKYGNRWQSRAADAVGIGDDILELRVYQARADATPAGAAERITAMQGKLARATGFNDIMLFDYEDYSAAGNDVVQAMVRRSEQAATRAQTLADRQADRDADEAADEAKERRTAVQTQAAWSSGLVRSSIAAGGSSTDFDVLASRDYAAGNLGNLVRAYAGTPGRSVGELWVSPLVSNQMQAKAMSGDGDTFDGSVKQAYQEWAALNESSSATAAAYYGEVHPRFQKMDRSIRGGGAEDFAYRSAFGDATIFDTASLSGGDRDATIKAIDAALEKRQSYSWNPFGERRLNDSGRRVAINALTNAVALAQANSDQLPADAAEDQMQALISRGGLEIVGPFAWRNEDNTTPLTQVTGIQADEFNEAFYRVADKALKARGYSDGASGQSYQIARNGNRVQIIAGTLGEEVYVTVSANDIKTAWKAGINKTDPVIAPPLSDDYRRHHPVDALVYDIFN